jgi:NADH-quinone oxidoreductase subunit N
LKYFLLGSFATAFFLYGVALMFGATGSTNIPDQPATARSRPHSGAGLRGVALMFVGLGFKVAAAPFHVWTPDVYEGAPLRSWIHVDRTEGGCVCRPLAYCFVIDIHARFWVIWIAAALSMTLGNISAMVQSNVKRLLAYSSIAHAGYLLMAFAAAPELGTSAAMFYLASYAAMNVGAFAVVSHFANAGERYVTLEDYEGLGRSSPLLAAALDYLSPFAHRHSDHWRLLRQVLRLQRGGQGEPDRPDDHRSAQQRHRRLLLLAHHRRDVHARVAKNCSRDAGTFHSTHSI